MEPKATNIWSAIAGPGDPFPPPEGWAAREASLVAVESTLPPRSVEVSRPAPRQVAIALRGVALNMPEEDIAIFDGLVRRIAVRATRADHVQVLADLEHDALWHDRVADGLPARTLVWLDRGPVVAAVAGRAVAIDPAHGGLDAGAAGPINLLEKCEVLDIALRLAAICRRAGMRVTLTREGDETITAQRRWRLIAAASPDLAVQVHSGHAAGLEVRGVRTLYFSGSAQARDLARSVQAEILNKLKLTDRGIAPLVAPAGVWLPTPAIAVETACIRHPVEEALLRSPVFKERMAWAIFNGIKNHLARNNRWQAPPSHRPKGVSLSWK